MPIRGSVGYTNVGNVSASPYNFTVTKPGGASAPIADDVVGLHVLVYSGGGIVRAVDSIPAGWTEETGARFTITSGSDNEVLRFYWYRATGSDPANWTFSLDGDAFVQYQIGVYSGRETSGSPVDAVSGQNGTTASCTAPSLTVSAASTDLVFVGTNLNGRTYTPPASDGWTERHEDSGTNNYWADKVAGAGATGSKTFTMNSADPNNGTMIALKPAGGGATNGTMSGAVCAATVASPNAVAAAGAAVVGQVATATAASPAATAAAGALLAGGAATATAGSPNGALVGGALLAGAVTTATAASPDGTLSASGVGTLVAAVATAAVSSPDANALAGAVLAGALSAGTATSPDPVFVGAAVLAGAVGAASASGPSAAVATGAMVLAALVAASGRSPTAGIDVFAGGASDEEPVYRTVVVPTRSLTLTVPARSLTVEVPAP